MSATIPIGVRMVGGTAFLASACAVGYIAGSTLRKNYKRAAKGVATSGVITDFQVVGVGAGSRIYCPKIEFQTLNGEKISFVSSYGSKGGPPKIGRKVKVLYDSENSQDAVEASFFKLWLFPLFFLVVAVVFLFFSLAFYTAMFGDAA
jgi:hypothetical protein